MPDTLISVPSAAARSSAAMTRCRRRAESAWRPFLIASVRGLAAAGRAGAVVLVMRRASLAGEGVVARTDGMPR